MIAVQDSLQPVQESQLWFLQSLLSKLVLIVHSFSTQSLQLCSKQGQAAMHHYLSGEARYCSTGTITPGKVCPPHGHMLAQLKCAQHKGSLPLQCSSESEHETPVMHSVTAAARVPH